MTLRIGIGGLLLALAAITPSVPASAAIIDGDVDFTFGVITSDLAPGFTQIGYSLGAVTEAAGLVRQPDGKYVAVGKSYFGYDIVSVARISADGTPDATFNTCGYGYGCVAGLGSYSVYRTVAPTSAVNQSGRAVALQRIGTNAGKIIVAGAADNRGLLFRIAPDSSVDSSFRNVYTVGLTDTAYNAVAVLPDDHILVAGTIIQPGRSDRDFYIAYYAADGGFIQDRIIPINLGGPGGSNDDEAVAMAVSGNRIVLAGSVDLDSTLKDCAVVALTLTNPDLQLDPGWAGNGISVESFSTTIGELSSDYCRAVALQNDGKVLVGGESIWNFTPDTPFYSPGSAWTMMRFQVNGTIDPSFSTAALNYQVYGFYNDNAGPGNFHSVNTIAVQTDGKIVFAGSAPIAGTESGPTNFGFGRLTPAGDLDNTFGGATTGYSTPNSEQGVPGTAQSVAAIVIDADRVVAVGTNHTNPGSPDYADFLFTRLQGDLIFSNGLE